jgi:Ca2+:H+ antiporter
MDHLLKQVRNNPLLWMLVFVPLVLTTERLAPSNHTLLFVLAILAIVPLAALLSHATESVAEKTGDAIGGLLNATLGNLTELIIAIAALRAGEYTLVKASIAGAIVTNSLFMLGASFLLGGRAPVPCSGIQSCYREIVLSVAVDGHHCAPRPGSGRRS